MVVLSLTPAQQAELDQCLASYEEAVTGLIGVTRNLLTEVDDPATATAAMVGFILEHGRDEMRVAGILGAALIKLAQADG